MKRAHRRDEPDRAPGAPGLGEGRRSSATERRVLMPPPARSVGRPVARVAAPSASNRRPAARAYARATARAGARRPSSPRATGPVSARSAPSAAQFSTVARTSGTSSPASDPAVARQALGRRLESDQEVRGDRGRGVVGGAVVSASLDGRSPSASARLCGEGQRPGRCGPPSPPRRRRTSRPAAVTVISGCSENASCGRQHVEPGGARAVADQRARGDQRRGPGDLPVGNAQQHRSAPAPSAPRPSGPRDSSRSAGAGRSASALPTRPRPTIARADRQGCRREVPVPVLAWRYRSEW